MPEWNLANNFEVKGWRIASSITEQTRAPRIVRVGIIQHSVVLPTDSPINEQRDAIHDKISKYVEHAANCRVNIVCLQEAWSKFATN